MRVVAYLHANPLLESPPAPTLWGWEVDQIYRDLSRVGQARPQLQQLLQDCTSGTIGYVLVRSLSELGESLTAVSDCLDTLESHGITVMALEQNYVSANITPADARTPISLPTARTALMQLAAAVQSQQRRQRLRQGHAHNRLKALPPPGRAPYGYRRGQDRYTLDRAAAPVVRDFFEQFLLFGSVRGAVRYLEQTYGKRISVSTGHRWLTHPVYRGDLRYQNGQVVPNTHAPIVPRDEAAQVDRLLRRNHSLPPRTASASRSLAGLVRCQACQSRLKVSRVSAPRREKTYLYLRPIACPRSPVCKAIPYEAVLTRSIEVVCRDLPAAVAALQSDTGEDADSPQATLQQQIAHKQAILDQMPDLVDGGVLDLETADLRTYKLQSEIAELQQRRSQLPPENLQTIAQTVSIPQFWFDLSEAERRFYLREFIHQIWLMRHGSDWEVTIQFMF